MKKGQGLTMDVIIIAAISLVVLVVLVAIFTGRLGGFTSSIKDCGAQGGTCMMEDACKEKGTIFPGKTSCETDSPDTPKCCIMTGAK